MNEQNEVDAALAELMNLAGTAASEMTDKHAPGKKSKPRKKRPLWWSVSRWVVPPVVLGLLPFVALLKGSTVLYRLTELLGLALPYRSRLRRRRIYPAGHLGSKQQDQDPTSGRDLSRFPDPC